jgi:serine protease Do
VRQTLALEARRPALVLLTCALVVGLALVAGPARAQGVTSETKAVALTSPAVSFVRTDLRVCVRARFSDLRACYRQAFSGSAFAVNPNGSLVTASHVVAPDGDDRRALQNYAANQLFVQLDPGDDPNARYELADPEANRALQACYEGDACAFTIKTTVRVYPAARVAGLSVPKPLAATVVRSSEFKQTDIAILQVDATNMPTVELEPSTNDLESGDDVVALGFPGSASDLPTGMTEPTKTFGRVSNIRPGAVGSSKQIEVDLDLKAGLSGGPVVGQNGVVGLTSYSLLGDDGTSEQGYIRTVEDIRAALKAAGVEAARGDGDVVFEQAMEHYWNHHYSAALPLYQKVLNLYDGHPMAKDYLAKAQAKANGPEDVPLPADSPAEPRRDLLRVWGPIAGVLLVLVVLAVVVLRRRPGHPATLPPAPPAYPPRPDDRPQPFGWQLDDGFPAEPGPLPPGPRPGADPAAPAEEPGRVATALEPSALEPSALDGFDRVTSPRHRFCSQCGNELDPGSRFCGACGHPLR